MGARAGVPPTLSIHTLAWGRTGALRPIPAHTPSLGYHSPGLTETWEQLGVGLEQTWVIERSPPGDGPLILEVAVDDGGHAWNAGHLAAWDARGRLLPADLAMTEAGLRVRVDDTGARYPVTVDPVYTTADWTGEESGTFYGGSVAGAGDINGDGFADILVSRPDFDGDAETIGGVYLYLGSVEGPSTTVSENIGPPDRVGN